MIITLILGGAFALAQTAGDCFQDKLLSRAAGHSTKRFAQVLEGSSFCDFSAEDNKTIDGFLNPKVRSAPGLSEELIYEQPRFRTPARFAAMNPCQRKHAVIECSARLDQSMKTLDRAISYAAVNEPSVQAMSRELARRLLKIIDAKAEVDVLGKGGRQPTAAEKIAIQQEANQRLMKAFGNCQPDQAGCLAGGCKDAACAQKQVHRLREGVTKGNLRESMFFLYLSNDLLTQNVSRGMAEGDKRSDVARDNRANLDALNARLKTDNEPWQITDLPTDFAGKYILPRYGYGADNGRMRDRRVSGDGKPACASSTRTIGKPDIWSLEFIPLSDREKEYLGESLNVKPASLSTQKIPYHSGESCFEMKKEITDPAYTKYNVYLENARAAKIPMLTGISGTTDSILTLGRTLGLKSQEDFEVLRGAALGWLVSSRDHSAHEVMTASISFKEIQPGYRFRPDYYKSILSHHPSFAVNVERFHRQEGVPLPQEVLDSCLTDQPQRSYQQMVGN